jgi:hypothetical protein
MCAALVIAMSEAGGTLRSFVGLNCALLRMTAQWVDEREERML